MSFNFISLSLKDIILYKKEFIPLNNNNLITVRGLNKDSNPSNSNACGKSLLFNSIPILFYDNSPSSNRKKSSKDLFLTKGEISIEAIIGKDKYVFTKYRYNKVLKLNILKNDENLRFQTSMAAYKYLEQCFPISQSMFYNLVYLRGANSNIIINGTNNARHVFFEELFKLTDYDKIAFELRKKYKKSYEYRIKYDTLKSSYIEVDVKKYSRLKNTINLINSRFDTYNKRYDNLLKTRSKIDNYNSLIQDIPKEYINNSQKLKKQILNVKKKIRILSKTIDKYNNIEQQWKDYNFYHKNKKSLNNKLKGINTRTLFKKIKSLIVEKDSLDALIINAKKYKNNIISYKKFLDLSYKALVFNPKGIEEQYHNSYASILYSKRLINTLGDYCPTCNQRVSDKLHKILIDNLTKGLKKQEFYFKSLKELYNNREKYIEIKNILEHTGLLSYINNEGIFDIDRLNTKYKQCSKKLKYYMKKRNAYQALKDLSPVNKPLVNINLPSLKIDLKKLTSEYNDLLKYNIIFKNLKKIKVPFYKGNIKKDIQRCLRNLQIFKDKKDKYYKKYMKLKEQINNNKKINKNLISYKKYSKDHKLLGALTEAYGPKGIRTEDIKDIVDIYVNNLNRFSSLIFSEPFEFSYTVDNRNLSIVAHRAFKDCDICFLSASEKQSFSLLSLLSLLSLIPDNYKTNILILDEIENCMSKENRQKLSLELLPKLQQVVPNIFVITPLDDSELYTEHSTNWTVVRKNNVSRVKK